MLDGGNEMMLYWTISQWTGRCGSGWSWNGWSWWLNKPDTVRVEERSRLVQLRIWISLQATSCVCHHFSWLWPHGDPWQHSFTNRLAQGRDIQGSNTVWYSVYFDLFWLFLQEGRPALTLQQLPEAMKVLKSRAQELKVSSFQVVPPLSSYPGPPPGIYI